MYQNLYRTRRVIVLLIKPFVLSRSHQPSPSCLLNKIPLCTVPDCNNMSENDKESGITFHQLGEKGWQGGRVVRVLDFESVGPGFESHSEHFMDLFLGCPEL